MTTRGRLINLISAFLDILSVALHLPALWTKVTEAIYDVRESDNFPRTFETHFIFQPLIAKLHMSKLVVRPHRKTLSDILVGSFNCFTT